MYCTHVSNGALRGTVNTYFRQKKTLTATIIKTLAIAPSVYSTLLKDLENINEYFSFLFILKYENCW